MTEKVQSLFFSYQLTDRSTRITLQPMIITTFDIPSLRYVCAEALKAATRLGIHNKWETEGEDGFGPWKNVEWHFPETEAVRDELSRDTGFNWPSKYLGHPVKYIAGLSGARLVYTQA